MFSGYELTAIKSWALTGKEILSGHLDSTIFTQAEKADKRREYMALENIIEKAHMLQEAYAPMDADHLIQVLETCTEYSTHLKAQLDRAEIGVTDYAAEMYQIGYIQGRAEIGLLTVADVTVVSSWEFQM